MAACLGVIVAGGRGTRLGLGIPKAMVRLGGMTLLERAIATLAPCCEAIAVAAPAGRPLSLPPSSVEVFAVADVAGARGPLAGLVAGLEARPHERALVLAVDLPLMRAGMLAALLERLRDRDAVIPSPVGVPQPLAAAYGSRAGAALAQRLRAGERSVSAAARALDPVVVEDAVLAQLPGGIESFFNLNTPHDLERAERLLRSREALEGAA
jgi:molybdenum cofactor guanylyltransferase